MMQKHTILKLIRSFLTRKTKEFIHQHASTHQDIKLRLAEEILYPKEVYSIYLKTQYNFNFCMHNRLLKRKDILEFKELLDQCIHIKDYSREKWKNDAHEIYKKLKSTNISKNQMLMLNKYLCQFLIEIPEPTKVYGHLRMIK